MTGVKDNVYTVIKFGFLIRDWCRKRPPFDRKLCVWGLVVERGVLQNADERLVWLFDSLKCINYVIYCVILLKLN